MVWKEKSARERAREARAAREQQRRAERLREAAEQLRELVAAVEFDANREGKPRPGHGGDLWRFLVQIAKGDLCLWAVLDAAGLADPNKFDWLIAMVAQAVAAHLTWTKPGTAHLRRKLEQSRCSRE
jgi:hypothetical protein